MVHLTRIKNSTDIFLKGNHSYLEAVQAQKAIYDKFFYIENLIKNLLLNDLITEFTKNQILVHYNFLSKFVHPTNESVTMYQHLSNIVTVPDEYRDDILVDLIILYVSKLMYLYIKTFVYTYRSSYNVLTSSKYDDMINELNHMSKDLWFLDNQPTDEDLRWSKGINHGYYNGIRIKDPETDLFYYTDPIERISRLRRLS